MAGTRRVAPSAERVPSRLAAPLGREPLTAVDVGAARGIPPHWRPFIEVMKVHAFEPREDECARLAATSHPNIRWHPVSLAGHAGPRQLHVLAVPTGSSLLAPDPRFVDLYGEPAYMTVAEVVDVDCATLGGHLTSIGEPAPALIKLDTQGTELEILQGLSREQLDGVLAIEIETEFHPVYQGQPLFPDVHAYLTGMGFELFDMRTQRVHLTGGRETNHYLKANLGTAVGTRQLSAKLHAADALYLRPFTSVAEAMTVGDFSRYATILQIYRAYDVIFWLLDQPRALDLFGEQGRFELEADYARAAPRPRLTQRTGLGSHLVRRGWRGLSWAAEQLLGIDGFRPPRTVWTHSFWPDQ